MDTALESCKNFIENSGFATKQAKTLVKNGIVVDKIVNPSTDWKEIKYYNNPINKTTKDNFKRYLSKELPDQSKLKDMPKNNADCHAWDKYLSEYIKAKIKKSAPTEPEQVGMVMADKVVGELYKTYKGLSFVQSKFHLYAFMRNTDARNRPKLYLWQGEADAIAFYNGRYVIVEFKTIDNDILGYKERSTDLCGKHLHQSLIYAQLLKLHMELDYLPLILIVVIDRYLSEIYPPLFENYPDECKEKLESFEWSKTPFTEKPPLKLINDGKLFNVSGQIGDDKKLIDILNNEATVKVLLDALGYGSLELT